MNIGRVGRMAAYGLFLVGSASIGSMALAQTAPAVSPPPVRSPIDDNGVNLATGGLAVTTTDLSIGSPGEGGLAHTRTWTGNGWVHGFFLVMVSTAPNSILITIGSRSIALTSSDGNHTFISDQGDGAQFAFDASGIRGTFTDSDGTRIGFDGTTLVYYNGTYEGVGTDITLPSGEFIKLTYQNYDVSSVRLTSVNSSSGYQLKYGYATSDIYGYAISKVTAINNAVDYCDPAVNGCSGLTQSWPTVTYQTTTVGSNKQESVTDALGRVARYTTNSAYRLIAIKRPSSGTDTETIGYDGNGRVATFSNTNATWTYGWSLSGTTLTGTVTDPLSHQRVTTADTAKVVLLTDRDGLNRTTAYQYDGMGRLTYKVMPEGTITSGTPTAGYTRYDYDSRGNLTTTTTVSKTPGTPANITTSASYPGSCANPLTCNKPTSTTDELGNVTDYSYDGATGLVTSIKAPAIGGVRPETRYSYTPLHAYYKQASGGSPVAATSIYKLTTVSACATGTAPGCLNTANEVRQSIDYGPQAAGTANNLLPYAVSAGAGDFSLWATTTSVYDMAGNPYKVDGPLAGVNDTTRYRYNAIHQLVGIVGPDPDGGSGPLKNRALRYTYNLDGFLTKTERGTVNSQSDPDWSTFSTLWKEERSYDFLDRPQFVGTSASSLSQSQITSFVYDNANHLTCTANWMKLFGTLDPIPLDACNIVNSGGTFGSDRIAHYGYDAADQLTSVITAFGTGQQRTDQTLTYTGDGGLQTIRDANNNLTTYEYDGFDRLRTVFYPLPSTPGTSSTTDYQRFTYFATGTVDTDRRRDGSSIGFTYDALNRLTAKTLPSGEPSVGYGYDNLGRITSASSATAALSYVYDALGRVTRQTSPQGNTDYQYDLASRRTRMTWPDAFYVTYDHLLTGETTAIRESGATSGPGVLATITYDDLGRRVSLARGNATTTSYCYGGATTQPNCASSSGTSYLTGIAQDLAASGADQNATFTWTPVSQLYTETKSNDAYAFRQLYNADRSYTANGLNQYTAAGNATPAYDAKGNLTGFWGNSYGYSSENLLTSATGTSGLTYDPAMRLYQVNGATATRFSYDGSDMIGEYNTGNALQRRYVFGPGTDEPLVWYEGSGTGDRRWLHADERGSVTAISDGAGNAIAIDSYDSYGMPATSNIGRFQYTGQMWLAETGGPPNGLYHYKARAYLPRLGRFLQTDPIGYQDGMNLYGYAGGDPVNNVDPSGTDDWDITPIIVTGRLGSGGGYPGWSIGLNLSNLIGGYPAISSTQPGGNITVTALHNCRYYGVCSRGSNAFASSILSVSALSKAFSSTPGDNGPAGGGMPQNPKPAPCSTTHTTADTIGDWANNIALGADVIAAGAGVAAVGTSWTGIGGVGFGTIAAGAKFVSFAATAVQAAEQYASGNSSGLRSTAIGAGVGLLVPGLLGAKQAVYGVGKTARDAFVRDAAGISTSQAAQAAACK